MSATLAAWWANPFTAVLIAIVMLLLLAAVIAGFVAVLRLGAIQLGGLLAQRTKLPPAARGAATVTPAWWSSCCSASGWCGLASPSPWCGRRCCPGRAWRTSPRPVAGRLGRRVRARAAGRARTARRAAGGGRAGDARSVHPAASAVHAGRDTMTRRGGGRGVDEHEVQAFIGAGEEAGILEREDAELVASIVDFSDTVAREIMTPRTDVVALPVDAQFEAVARRFAESMFTRIPVYRETLDRIEGLLHVKDVLRATQAGTRPGVAELMHPVLVVPETKQLRELLREFQAARQQLAVLVDEYGGTSGIVTLEDVLEEIVGEIQDEHEREQPDVQPDGEGAFLVRGTAHIEELEELFGVAVGETGFDSVAGLVLDRLGHLPRPGEKLSWHGLELEAVEVDRRRLRRLRIRRAGAGR
jgi:Mg2+/Co2+ transporter CorC